MYNTEYGARSRLHTLRLWSFSAWVSLQSQPVAWQLPTAGQQAANCWDDFTALLQLRESSQWPAATGLTLPFILFLSLISRSTEVIKTASWLLSQVKPKWKVGQEWLHFAWLPQLWWCHYRTIFALKYYSRPSPHIRCQANCLLPKLISWTLDSAQFSTAVIENIRRVYLRLADPGTFKFISADQIFREASRTQFHTFGWRWKWDPVVLGDELGHMWAVSLTDGTEIFT